MIGNFKRLRTDEHGSVQIVEAAFVFPVTFIILLFLIYMGNAYFLKSQVESVAEMYAVKGAAYCADPMLETIKETGSVPSLDSLHIKPYRYVAGLFGDSMGEVEDKISNEVKKAINEKSGTFFFNMKPTVTNSDIASYNNHILYSTFSVKVECSVPFPIRFFSSSPRYILRMNAYAEVAVNDTGEFIRNTDMVIDYFENIKLSNGKTLGETVSDIFGKINSFLETFAGK